MINTFSKRPCIDAHMIRSFASSEKINVFDNVDDVFYPLRKLSESLITDLKINLHKHCVFMSINACDTLMNMMSLITDTSMNDLSLKYVPFHDDIYYNLENDDDYDNLYIIILLIRKIIINHMISSVQNELNRLEQTYSKYPEYGK